MHGLIAVAKQFNAEIIRRGATPVDLFSGALEDGSGVLFYLDLADGVTLTIELGLRAPRPSAQMLEAQLRGLLCFPRAGEPLH
jgi:hypothetical protein